MTDNFVAYQLIPKVKHSRNSSEKEIQTWKYPFLSGMASTHPNFTLPQWCKPVEKGNITLNLLLPYRINPKLSAYAQVFGNFDYQKTSLSPPGMKLLAHVLPIDHRSFYPHAINGFSVGVAMEH